MVTPIKDTTDYGLYFLTDDVWGWVGNNAPEDADLDSLTENQTYIYFETVLVLQGRWTCHYEGASQVGYKSTPNGEGTRDYYTEGHDKEFLDMEIECDRTKAKNFLQFFKYWNKTARASDEIYLIRQYTSEGFKQFANQTPALKYFCPVIIRNVVIKEPPSGFKQQLSIFCEVVW